MAQNVIDSYEEIHNANNIRVIENPYDKAQSAVLFNGSTWDYSKLQSDSDTGVYSHQHSVTSS